MVDLDELLLVLANIEVGGPGGDVNGDGNTDLDDLLVVLAEFGLSCSSCTCSPTLFAVVPSSDSALSGVAAIEPTLTLNGDEAILELSLFTSKTDDWRLAGTAIHAMNGAQLLHGASTRAPGVAGTDGELILGGSWSPESPRPTETPDQLNIVWLDASERPGLAGRLLTLRIDVSGVARSGDLIYLSETGAEGPADTAIARIEFGAATAESGGVIRHTGEVYLR